VQASERHHRTLHRLSFVNFSQVTQLRTRKGLLSEARLRFVYQGFRVVLDMTGIGWRNKLPASRIGQSRIETSPTCGDMMWPQNPGNISHYLLIILRVDKACKDHGHNHTLRRFQAL
jgi:hypothetical protein